MRAFARILEKTHPLLVSQACQANLGMTKRVGDGSITLDDYDAQTLEVARQVETGLFMISIDHLGHHDDVCNFLLDDLVIDSGAEMSTMLLEAQTNRVLSTVYDSRRICPRRVFEDDTIVVSCGLENLNVLSGRSSTFRNSGDRTMNWLQWQTMTRSRKASRTISPKSATLVHYG